MGANTSEAGILRPPTRGVVAGMTLSGDVRPQQAAVGPRPGRGVRGVRRRSEANTLRDTGDPIVVITSVGAKSGNLRKNPVMRVERDGTYVAIASKGGADDHPEWYYNFLAHPEVELQDGAERHTYRVRLAEGDERADWWELRGRHLADVRRVPEEDRPRDPGLPARARLTDSVGTGVPRRRAVTGTIAGGQGATRWPSRASSESRNSGPPRRPMTTTRSCAERAATATRSSPSV